MLPGTVRLEQFRGVFYALLRCSASSLVMMGILPVVSISFSNPFQPKRKMEIRIESIVMDSLTIPP